MRGLRWRRRRGSPRQNAIVFGCSGGGVPAIGGTGCDLELFCRSLEAAVVRGFVGAVESRVR